VETNQKIGQRFKQKMQRVAGEWGISSQAVAVIRSAVVTSCNILKLIEA
jgi:hypothetical protein